MKQTKTKIMKTPTNYSNSKNFTNLQLEAMFNMCEAWGFEVYSDCGSVVVSNPKFDELMQTEVRTSYYEKGILEAFAKVQKRLAR